MTEQEIPTKWMFIATWLIELKAPKKVINAAIAIDDALDDLGLGHNTEAWKQDYNRVLLWKRTSFNGLHSLIMNDRYCTACEECECSCLDCKLGDEDNCTPRYWHADEYFTIIKRWIHKGC